MARLTKSRESQLRSDVMGRVRAHGRITARHLMEMGLTRSGAHSFLIRLEQEGLLVSSMEPIDAEYPRGKAKKVWRWSRQAQADARIEPEHAGATVRPENPATETVAEIWVEKGRVIVSFPEKRDDFKEIVKTRLGFCWNVQRLWWERDVKGGLQGLSVDRAAELGHRLLDAGFIVRIVDDIVRHMSVAGTYKPEVTRWIDAKGSQFRIRWRRRDDDAYTLAKRITASRWDNPYMMVPCEHYGEVLDFAELHSFYLSPAAQRLADRAKVLRDNSTVFSSAPEAEDDERLVDAGPPDLKNPGDIAIPEDLRDDL